MVPPVLHHHPRTTRLQGLWGRLLLLHAKPVSVSPAVRQCWGHGASSALWVGVSLGNVGKGTGAAPAWQLPGEIYVTFQH